LYFRGKLAYATAFSSAPDGLPGRYHHRVRRALPPETPINREQLCLISSAPVRGVGTALSYSLSATPAGGAHLTGDCEIVLLVRC